ncbi:TolC family protein [Balneolaceae bacterium ANBcel3]|nr:TolC family protein [Balneolaceae bacterium ANBcel3]
MKKSFFDRTTRLALRWMSTMALLVVVSGTSWSRPPLEDVLHQAISHSHTLSVLDQEVEKVRLQRKMVYQSWLPKAGFESSIRFLDEDIAFAIDPLSIPMPTGGALNVDIPPLVLQDKQTARATIQVSQPLFTGLKVPRMGRAARHGEQAAVHQAESGTQQVLLDVASVYDQLYLVDEAMKVVERAEERLQEEKRMAEKAYQEGLIPAYDLTRLDIASYELERQRIGLLGKKEMLAWKMEHLTGMARSSFMETTEGGLSPVAGIASVSAGEHPDVLALREANQMAHYQYRAQQSDYLPQVFAFYRRELYEDDLSVLDPVRVFGVGLKWDIFDGYNRARRVQIAERDRVIMRHRLEEAKSLSMVNRRQQEIALEVAQRQLALAETEKKDAETALRLSTRRYRLGLATVSEKLEAETGYQNAQKERLHAIVETRKAYREALLANGKLTIEQLVLMDN